MDDTDAAAAAVVDLLAHQWRTMAELGDELRADEWAAPTDLPGWSVKDCYSHVIGFERMLQGEPLPEVDLGHLEHLSAPSSAVTEPPVELRRPRPPAEVLTEFRQITDDRLATLRSLSPEAWGEVTDTLVGRMPYLEFMHIRQFDAWMHEQDCRRAVGRPGHQEGPAAEQALGRCVAALPFVVGKQAAAPDGSTVVFDLTGPSARRVAIGVDGRAALLDEVPPDPTVTLSLTTEAFWCLGGGRWAPDEVLGRGAVTLAGDRALGEAVVRALNFMI